MSNHDQLERRLQTAGSTFDEVTIAPDAWQENRRRLAEDRSRRNRWLLGAVAAGLVAVLVGGAALLATQAVDSGPPASSGSDDPWAPENVLGPPVVLERIATDGRRVDLQGVLSDTTGDGPNLCTQAVAEGYGFGSCIAREPSADKPSVAVDWLLPIKGDGDLRGVVAGVDSRASFVTVWMSDGERVPTALRPTGWENTKILAYTVPADEPRPQRLVAYGRDGNVLQAVDLAARFGDWWLTERSACAGDDVVTFGTQPTKPGDVFAAVGTTDAKLSVLSSTGTYGDRCVTRLRSAAIAGWFVESDRGVVVVAPEVDSVRLTVSGSVEKLKPSMSEGTMWKAVGTRLAAGTLDKAEIVAYDAHGIELDREFVNQPVSP